MPGVQIPLRPQNPEVSTYDTPGVGISVGIILAQLDSVNEVLKDHPLKLRRRQLVDIIYLEDDEEAKKEANQLVLDPEKRKVFIIR